MNAAMILGEQHFDLVVTRGDGVSIYRGDGRYLRIGPADELDEEIAIQRRMLDAGFPVPDLIEIGEHQGLRYVIESSLGSDTLGDQFDSQVERAFECLAEQLSEYPGVLTHNDFHAFNICERGVIDLETVDRGPAGYDLVCAIIMPELFPTDPLDYRFSLEQQSRYLEMVDAVFADVELPAPSGHLEEFRLCRSIWLAARRERPPVTLAWLDRQCSELLETYLSNFDSG